MTSQYWRLNGHLLRDTGVTDVVVNPHPATVPVEKNIAKTGKRSFTAQIFEEGVGSLSVQFVINGDGANPGDELDWLIGQLESSPFTLEAQANKLAGPALLWRNNERVAFSLDNVEQTPNQNLTHWILKIRCNFLGAWNSDGGGFTRERRGWFEQVGSQLKNQDGEDVANFEIEIPEQESGFPLARQAVDNQEVELSPVSSSTEQTRDGETRPLETYDLSGFIHPSDPSSDGETGQYKLETSPSLAYLTRT